MARSYTTYTYRRGKKLKLRKRKGEFVVRRLPGALPEPLAQALAGEAEQLSSASSRVSVAEDRLDDLMREVRAGAVAHHAYEDAATGREFLISDRIIATLAPGLSAEQVGALAGDYALEIAAKLDTDTYLFRLTDATGMNPVKLVVKLTEKDDRVRSVEHDLNHRINTAVTLPTDPRYRDQWHLHQHHASVQFDPRASARCEQAWQRMDGFGEPAVVVGVSDDGCLLSHGDFNSPGKFAGWGYFEGFNLKTVGDFDADPAAMYESGSNHGTACCGVIGAATNGQMVVGAAPGCALLPIKWESSGPSLFISDVKLLIALDYIADKVDVFSNSWSSVPESDWAQPVVDKIERLSRDGGRRGKGIVFLWAAGNDNCPINHQADQDLPYTTGWRVHSDGTATWVGVATARDFFNDLADLPGVMHVAASASTAQRSHYSNYGPGIDICAPSSNGHAYHRMLLDGLGVTTTTGTAARVRADFGGTSSATPLVAGVAALVISANPQLGAWEVISLLKRTASKDLDMTGYPRTPAASFDPDTSWDVSPVAPFDSGAFQQTAVPEGSWSPWFGHGRVDALDAVSEALRLGGERTEQLRFERADGLEIPDADPTGVVSRMSVQQAGRIESLAVDVNITHTYIGDLEVVLVAPDGRRVVLHKREGGRTDDLIQRYGLAEAPALGDLLGGEIRGVWTLEVTDLARRDIGRLNRWALEAAVQRDSEIRLASSPALAIPDNDPQGIADRIRVDQDIRVAQVRLELDISHTWRNDLVVELQAPSGTSARVSDREGGSAHDIRGSFDNASEPRLAALLGESSRGVWTLKVSDHAGRDVGKLNHWELALG